MTGTTPPITAGIASGRSCPDLRFKRHVGSAEIHGLGLNLLDAAARADGLVVEAGTGFGFVSLCPFGVNRVGEGSAGAGNVDAKAAELNPKARAVLWWKPVSGQV